MIPAELLDLTTPKALLPLLADTINRVRKVDSDGRGSIFINNSPQVNLKSSRNMQLTETEIAKHATENDCWMIINDKVYNLSGYASIHPGGASKILKYCGKVGTEGWQTKDKPFGKIHSSLAQMMLSKYYIGDLGSTTNTGSTSTNSNTNTNNTTNSGTTKTRDSERENEGD